MSRPLAMLVLAAGCASMAGCEQPELADQPKYEPYETAPGWPEDQSARQPAAGTVARGDPMGEPPDKLPLTLDRALLERGRQRFEIFCAPCHDRLGSGNGNIVQQGFPAPPTFHDSRLREVPLKYFYDVIGNGFGVMASYADRVPPEDRWAIAAYIRALQHSQHTRVETLTPDERDRLGEQP